MHLLDAVVASPVRRTVKPAGIPDDEVATPGGAPRRRLGAGAWPSCSACGSRPRRPGGSSRERRLQSNRRLSTRRRAVKPAASETLFGRAGPREAPGRRRRVHPCSAAPGDRGFHQGRADADAPRPRLRRSSTRSGRCAVPAVAGAVAPARAHDGALNSPTIDTASSVPHPSSVPGVHRRRVADEGGSSAHRLGHPQCPGEQPRHAGCRSFRAGRAGSMAVPLPPYPTGRSGPAPSRS